MCFDNSALRNLKNGSVQGGFIVFLVDEYHSIANNMEIMKWRVVGSAIAAEILIKIEAAKACFWLANVIW